MPNANHTLSSFNAHIAKGEGIRQTNGLLAAAEHSTGHPALQLCPAAGDLHASRTETI